MIYYKFLNRMKEPLFPPRYRYQLGKWQPPVSLPLREYRDGYQVFSADIVAKHIAKDLYIAEIRGETMTTPNQVVIAEECRIVEHLAGWNERTQRLFAADCGERVLPIYEREYPNDDRLRGVIQTARDYANGLTDYATLAATGEAALSILRSATEVAAITAAWAAAKAATRDASWIAAAGAAWAAAEAADEHLREREWQSARLLDYAYGRLP